MGMGFFLKQRIEGAAFGARQASVELFACGITSGYEIILHSWYCSFEVDGVIAECLQLFPRKGPLNPFPAIGRRGHGYW